MKLAVILMGMLIAFGIHGAMAFENLSGIKLIIPVPTEERFSYSVFYPNTGTLFVYINTNNVDHSAVSFDTEGLEFDVSIWENSSSLYSKGMGGYDLYIYDDSYLARIEPVSIDFGGKFTIEPNWFKTNI